MNNTSGSSGEVGSGNISGLGFVIGVSAGIVLLIVVIYVASYICARTPVPIRRGRVLNNIITAHFHLDHQPQHSVVDVDQGLDEATIVSYPKLLYSEFESSSGKLGKSDSGAASACSICLADYKGSDMVRVLPDCGHLFHLGCIDPWLRMHPTCPLCRTSPIPSPLSTPLAEVLPLAITTRDNIVHR